MSRSLRGKINNLENRVLQPFEVGSTKFCHWALPETEQRLLEKAHEIALYHDVGDELTVEQRTILTQATRLMQARIFDLVTSYLVLRLCQGDRYATMKVHERFVWFIRELKKEVAQELEVAEIEKNANPEDEVDRVDEYYRNAPKVFTEDSYYELLDEIFREVTLPHILVNSKRQKSYVQNQQKRS